jgi:hypothetical protein
VTVQPGKTGSANDPVTETVVLATAGAAKAVPPISAATVNNPNSRVPRFTATTPPAGTERLPSVAYTHSAKKVKSSSLGDEPSRSLSCSDLKFRPIGRRRLRVRPVAGADAEAADVVDGPPADDAVEDDPFKLAFQVGLHAQEFRPEHLHANDHPVRPVEPGGHRLVDDRARGRGLLGHALDRSFEDRAFVGSHGPNGRGALAAFCGRPARSGALSLSRASASSISR